MGIRSALLALLLASAGSLIGTGVASAGNGALPDLVVVSIDIEPETLGACDAPTQLGVRVRFSNQGNADAGAFAVEVNGAQQTVTGGLAVGATSSLWFPGFQIGSNTAIVDATGLVPESDETNNMLSGGSPPTPSPTPTCTPTLTPSVTPVAPTDTPTPTGGIAGGTSTRTSTVAAVGLPDVGDGKGTGSGRGAWVIISLGALAFVSLAATGAARVLRAQRAAGG